MPSSRARRGWAKLQKLAYPGFDAGMQACVPVHGLSDLCAEPVQAGSDVENRGAVDSDEEMKATVKDSTVTPVEHLAEIQRGGVPVV